MHGKSLETLKRFRRRANAHRAATTNMTELRMRPMGRAYCDAAKPASMSWT